MRRSTQKWLHFKLAAIVISVTVVALGLFAVFVGHRVERLEYETASASLHDQSRTIRDMLAVNHDSMTIAADKLFAVFDAMLGAPFSLDATHTMRLGGQEVPVLRVGGVPIGPDFAAVDEFSRGSGGHPATVFVRHGDDFLRLATSLRDAQGNRAVGTPLGHDHPAHRALMAGEPYSGHARLFGRPYMTEYRPLFDAAGRVIGVLFVGLDLSDTIARIKDRIQAIRVGRTGYVYVLDTTPGGASGNFVIHPTLEGRSILAAAEPADRPFFRDVLAGGEDRVGRYAFPSGDTGESREKIAAFVDFPQWHWVIAAGAYFDEFTEERQHLENAMVGAMIVAALAIIMALSISIRRMVLAPLLAMHETLRASEERFRTLVTSSDDIIYTADCAGRYTGIFGKGLEGQGWTAADFVGRRPCEVFGEDGAAHEAAHAEALRGTHLVFEWTRTRAAASADFQISLSPIRDDDGRICGLVGIGRDVTARKETEARLMLAASVFTHAEEGIIITDATGTIVEVNDTFSRITGYARDEVLGRNPRMLNSGRHDRDFYASVWRALTGKGHWHGEIWNRRKDGALYAEMLNISAVCDAGGQTQHYVGLFSDITSLKEHQRQLERIAHYDALTGLPNRVLLADRLQQAIVRTRRRENLMALVYLDLDGFKAVNDGHGHEAGDELLVAVSSRLKAALREGDTLARLGGDEFVAVLTDLEDASGCDAILSRLLQAAAAPVQIGDVVLQVSASLGVTLHPLDGGDADTLLRHADQAMYQAKEAGRNRYQMFDPDHDRQARSQRETLQRTETALERNEFVLHYQPRVNMRSGAVLGAEALIRWQDPERGLLAPGDFLPGLEDSELIVRIGDWVLDAALAQMAAWRHAGLDVAVSVNVAAHHLQQDDFVARLQAKLAGHPDLPAGRLELEVLETVALEDVDRMARIMEACRALGVDFALDDFGTGYSSLTYLRRLPATVLKIDRSFVRDMLWNAEDLTIVEGVIGLAAAFRRTVIAEGVESAEHGALLLELGCDLAQGYGIARPMPPDQLPGWVRQWRPAASWAAQRERPAQPPRPLEARCGDALVLQPGLS